jgi:F-type H+-transporting ATPase subunit epsilon
MAAPRLLDVRVVSPEKTVFEGEARSVVAPAHAPLIALLGDGELVVDTPGGGSRSFWVSGGLLKVELDQVTVLTDRAGDSPIESAATESIEAATGA